MQQFVDGREAIALGAGQAGRRTRSLLPLLLAPCIPGIVACNTADVRSTAPAITAEAVARTGLPPFLLRPLSKGAAEALNQRIPFSPEPVIAAAAFVPSTSEETRARATECLTSAIYYEAASESEDGQRGVAQVILNRVRHPAFPASICGVVYQGSTLRTGCQFSFTCDGSLQRAPSRREWDRARLVAEAAIGGAVYAPVGVATHYHADYVVPYWAPSLAKTVQVGAHIFYRWAGDWGRPPSFTQPYARGEASPAALRNIALISHGIWPGAISGDEPRLALEVSPEVESQGVLRLLTDASPGTGAFEKQVRAYFQAQVAAPVVNVPTAKLTPAALTNVSVPSPPAEAVAAPEAVAAAAEAPVAAPSAAEFARQSKFAAFLRGRRPLYKAVAAQAVKGAEQAAADWEIYSGLPVPAGKAVLSLTQFSEDACAVPAPRIAARPVLRWAMDGAMGPADMLIGAGLAHNSITAVAPRSTAKARALAASLEGVEDQLVRAVFVRIAVLSRGEAVGNALIRSDIAAGHALVPVLAARLRFFEQHRAEYGTLAQYLPTLVAGLPRPKADAKAADDAQLASCAPAVTPVR